MHCTELVLVHVLLYEDGMVVFELIRFGSFLITIVEMHCLWLCIGVLSVFQPG